MGSETRARLALGGLLATSLISYELVFEGDGYVGPVLLACLLAMGISALARRWGAGPILTFEFSLAGLFLYLTIVFQAGESFWGLPTPASATGLTRLIRLGYDTSQVDYAPVPVRAGYVIMIVVGFWMATTCAEIATFRWRRPVIAAIPCMTLFSVATIVGTSAGSFFFLALFLIALLTFWATEASHRLRSWGRWMSTWDNRPDEEPERVTGALARRMGASCIAATLIAPIFIPTLGGGWLPWRSGKGVGSGSGSGGGNVNLLVDIAPKLIDQTDIELFTVRAPSAAYWRLASLVDYDGRLWHELDGDRQSAEDGATFATFGPSNKELIQQIEITGLEGEFLPAATHPVRLEGQVAEFDPDTLDLKVDDVTEGMTYTVSSSIPEPTYRGLRKATIPESPPGGDPAYLETGPISDDVGNLLTQWTGDEQTDFEKLLAIQNHLRSSEFDYRTDVEATESRDYLGDFLLETKAGFCQQFSTAFALLARELGYPSRVSVGFLSGSAAPAEEGLLFTVSGTDAHAWPEVYFEDYGWVAFEPTARSISSIPRYTTPATSSTPSGPGGPGDTADGPAPDDPGVAGGTNDLRDRFLVPRDETTPEPVEEPAWQAAFLRLALVMGGLLLLWAVAVPTLKAERLKRAYRRARTPAETAIAAFMHFEFDAAEVFLPRSAAEPATSFAARLGGLHRVPPQTADRLARLYEAAVYSPGGITDTQAAEAKKLATQLAAIMWARSSMWQKAWRLFSVRSLLPQPGTRWPRGRHVPAPT